jgi:hypothetical protein
MKRISKEPLSFYGKLSNCNSEGDFDKLYEELSGNNYIEEEKEEEKEKYMRERIEESWPYLYYCKEKYDLDILKKDTMMKYYGKYINDVNNKFEKNGEINFSPFLYLSRSLSEILLLYKYRNRGLLSNICYGLCGSSFECKGFFNLIFLYILQSPQV